MRKAAVLEEFTRKNHLNIEFELNFLPSLPFIQGTQLKHRLKYKQILRDRVVILLRNCQKNGRRVSCSRFLYMYFNLLLSKNFINNGAGIVRFGDPRLLFCDYLTLFCMKHIKILILLTMMFYYFVLQQTPWCSRNPLEEEEDSRKDQSCPCCFQIKATQGLKSHHIG